jgi:S-adenosyl-L-methionine hydrolase (adenosine-forming)
MVVQGENSNTTHVPTIALLTDFGTQDAYVGMMKGVILSICPTAQIIDLTHHIQPQNVRQAAYVLLQVYQYLPPQTIVVVVVDPGVGSARRAVGIQTESATFIGPDNGVFSYVLRKMTTENIVSLQNYNLPNKSSTFHGRDVFSPSAAHLASGVKLDALGPTLKTLEKLPAPRFDIHATEIHGEVLYIDHFGNVVTSIGSLEWDTNDLLRLRPIFEHQHTVAPAELMIRPEDCEVDLGEHRIAPLSLTYAGVSTGHLLMLINSAGQLEVAMNQGNAAEQLNAHIGQQVTLRLH